MGLGRYSSDYGEPDGEEPGTRKVNWSWKGVCRDSVTLIAYSCMAYVSEVRSNYY